ncbi:MAG TPA: GNAT family N-acetyltransferase [Gemmataceae bacterium]|nr:GNAT family N-acetyltransferase [Gemmataceae bacterium]
MKIDIREANGTDLDHGLLETLSSLAHVGLTSEKAREIFRARLRTGARTYVAVADGRIIGTVSLLIEQKFIHGGGLVGHIEDVAVHGSHQNQGIASNLVRHAIAEARQQGCYKVVLGCYDSLAPFYERLGFRRHDVGMRLDLNTCYNTTGAAG